MCHSVVCYGTRVLLTADQSLCHLILLSKHSLNSVTIDFLAAFYADFELDLCLSNM